MPFGVMTFHLFLTFDFEVIIDFNQWYLDNFYFQTISRELLAGLFSYCIHISPLGLDVPFEGYDL